jgi:progesterone-induced-blocking factor 1
MDLDKENILELADRYNISRVGLQQSDLEELTSPSEVSASEEDSMTNKSTFSRSFSQPSRGAPPDSPNLDELSTSALSLPESVLGNDSDDSFYGTGRLGAATGTGAHKIVTQSVRRAQNTAKQTYQVREGALEDQISLLSHKNAMLEAEMRRLKEQHARQVQGAMGKTNEVMEKIRTKQAFLEAEVPALKRKLQDSKMVFGDLTISDLRFQELKRTLESSLSLKDYVCMKTHEVVQQFKKQAEDARKQAEQAREVLASTAENLDASSRDSSHKERLLSQQAKALQRDLEQSEAARVGLEQKLKRSVRDVDELRTKGAQYDATNERRAELEVEHVTLKERLDKQAAALVSLTEARDAAHTEHRRALQTGEVLKVDKDYLARERDTLRASLTKAEREHDRLHDRVNELQRAKEEYHNQLLESRQDNKSKYEERLTAEVRKLQEASSKDLEIIRSNGQEVWERENRTLREAREAALAEVERFHTKVVAMTASHDELVLKQAQTTAQYEAQVAELRNQVKMKHFENAQVECAYLSIYLSIYLLSIYLPRNVHLGHHWSMVNRSLW